ncbi:hypothetical protein [Pseudoalteromonas denitrificans]|uniref:Uncharacterized protein n=1 Tax=Pseudoalteromonas denitrificans DSM 6059 TaxID=1123010 RepID=A0A1I1I6J5_9GAMM|nr:hypothetical protein [Pseudoalteromonas denitrificans]SFC31927.1 hypothetical protein SAMN02745724_01406 [Pseudoalteromonas denitrificans DSM 6059]
MPVRDIKAGYLNLTAKVASNKLNRMTDAESSLERFFLFLLDNNPVVKHFYEQPVSIQYGKNLFAR